MYLLYFDHNDDSYSRKWMRKINFFTHAILLTLPSRFCAPFLFTFHYYLRMLWCTYAHKTIWLYYSINFLPPQTYLLMLQTPKLRTIDTKLTNYWYKTYKLLIQNLQTIDTKLTNYWYKTYKLLILNLQTTNPFCYKLQILKLQTTNPFWYKLQILILQTTNPFC